MRVHNGVVMPEEVHLLDYLQVIKRRKWIIIACFFITIITVIIGNYTMEPVYQATAQLIIDREQRKSPVTGEMMEYESYESESLTFQTYFSLIDSFPVLKRVVETLPDRQRKEVGPGSFMVFKDAIIENIRKIKQFIRDLFPAGKKEGPPIDDPSRMLHYQVGALRGRISVEPVRDTRLVNINVQDTDPLLARDIANGVAGAYIEYHMTSRIQAAKSSMTWLTQELQDMKDKIKESERKFYEFKEQEGIFSIKDKQGIDIRKIGDINSYYGDARSKRLEVEAKIEELKNILNHNAGERITPTIVDSNVLKNLHSELVLAEIELSKLQETFKWKHPKILEIKSKIQETKTRFDAELKKTMNNLRSEYKVLKDREQSFLSTIRQYEKEALGLNKKEMQYAILEREVETNKELYNLLLTKFKEANILEDMNMSNIRLVEPAVTPEIPIKPRSMLNLILGTIVGLMLGVGLSFFFEYLDRTIKTPEEVEQCLGLPILGAIPKVSADSSKLKAQKIL
jgi:succinoglycan biosynthesis transport protein ExoP